MSHYLDMYTDKVLLSKLEKLNDKVVKSNKIY